MCLSLTHQGLSKCFCRRFYLSVRHGRWRRLGVILVDENHPICHDHTKVTEEWNELGCYDQLEPSQTFQLKQDNTHFYIYCFNSTLKLNGFEPIQCGNVVYRIPHSVEFWVDDKHYSNQNTRVATTTAIDYQITETVNRNAFLGNASALNDLEKLINEQKEINDQINSGLIHNNTGLFLFGSGAGSLVILVVILIIARFCGFTPVQFFNWLCSRNTTSQTLPPTTSGVAYEVDAQNPQGQIIILPSSSLQFTPSGHPHNTQGLSKVPLKPSASSLASPGQNLP